jgi:hypothetical protein
MRALLLTITLAALTATANATIYRWVDEQGVTHYSDQPHTGAEKVHVDAPQVYTASPPPKTSNSPSGLPLAGGQAHLTCEIESPANDQMFMNAHSVSGHVRLSFDPGPGLRLSVLLDGKPVPSVDASGGFTMDEIERGTHTLTATVVDPAGQTVCQSQSIMFHVHQPSQQAPNAVNRPKF